jgi:hypothetical protein
MNRTRLINIYIVLYTTAYVGITSLPNLFFFLWSEFDQEVSFHYTAQNGNVFFYSETHIYKGQKIGYAIYGHIILIRGHSDPDQ